MAATATINIRGTIEGLPAGIKHIFKTLTNAASLSREEQLVLDSGDNTIVIPATALGLIIIFDPSSTTTKTLKQNANDQGLVLRPNGFNIIQFDLSAVPIVSAILINSSADDTGCTTTLVYF